MEHFDEWLNEVLGPAAQNRLYKIGVHSFSTLKARTVHGLLTQLPEQDVVTLVGAWVYPFDDGDCAFTVSVKELREKNRKAASLSAPAETEEDDLRPEYNLTELRRVVRQHCTGCKKRVPIDEFTLHPSDSRYRRTVCQACFDEAEHLTEQARQEGIYICRTEGVQKELVLPAGVTGN